MMKTSEEKFPVELKVKVKDTIKYFEVGESVRIIQGAHVGEAGIIADIIADKHAVITMEETNSELKILLSNLRSKQ